MGKPEEVVTSEHSSDDFVDRLTDQIRRLPPDLQKEVEDFIEFLMEKHGPHSAGRLRVDWAGALREYRDKYTSLELQKKALEWRGD